MIHLGIDHHKKYCHVVALNDKAEIVWDGRLASERRAFAELKKQLPQDEPIQSVLEAGWNWGKLYDALHELGFNPKLANPLKTRLIAESYVKTDRIDALVHAQLLRVGMTPLVHVPTPEQRDQKNVLRRRIWLVRIRTALKNRIHALLDRNHLEPRAALDLFAGRGRNWIDGLQLRDPEDRLLKAERALLDEVAEHIRQTEKWIAEELKTNALFPNLMTLPGVGRILGAVIALEVGDIDRFLCAERLCSYSGLVSSTYSSGGKTRHGGLIPTSNAYLRFAYVEATWSAIRVSPYLRAFYQRLKLRVGTSKAIVATARKLCEISFYCMKQQRAYIEKPYRFRSGSLGRVLT